MSDLISRADAIDTVEELNRKVNDGRENDTICTSDVLRRIKALPSAEAVQGEWIDYIGVDLGIEGQWLRDDGKTVFVQCDQCDRTFVRNLMTHMNYCPNCGAKMKGADHEVD